MVSPETPTSCRFSTPPHRRNNARSCCWPPSTSCCSRETTTRWPRSTTPWRRSAARTVKPGATRREGAWRRSSPTSARSAGPSSGSSSPRAPRRPTRSVAATRSCPGCATWRSCTAVRPTSPCSTSGRRPASTCSSTTTPTPTAHPRATGPAPPAGRGRRSGCAARSAGASTACPIWRCLPWVSAWVSTSPPSTRVRTTRPDGSWRASGPTTPSGSAACAPPSRTRAPPGRRRAWSGATWSRTWPTVAATVPGDGPLVVFHSWVAAYLEEERQHALAAEVRALDGSGRRPVHHLYLEAAYETPGLPTPPPPESGGRGDVATALVLVPAGGGEPVRLADAHPHGRWLRWWPATRRGPRGRRAAPAPARRPR